MELQISKLRKQAEDIIFWHKVGSCLKYVFNVGYFFIKKDAIKKIGKVFELNPNFYEEINERNNIIFDILCLCLCLISPYILLISISESLLGIPIQELNSLLDVFEKKYREKKINLKNTYVQASNYFQH